MFILQVTQRDMIPEGKVTFINAIGNHQKFSAGRRKHNHHRVLRSSCLVSCCSVCGLRSKINMPEFRNILSDYDLVVRLETKLDDADEMWLNNFSGQLGFCAFINNRKTLSVRRSGGIVVLVKTCLKQYIKSTRKNNEIIQWVLFDKKLFDGDKDLLIGGLYIPPEHSVYGGTHLFDELDADMISYTRGNDCHVCILGDFNAHTKNMPDFFELDDFLIDELDLGDIFTETKTALRYLETKGILNRTSKDVHVNNYGYRMVDFCASHGILLRMVELETIKM